MYLGAFRSIQPIDTTTDALSILLATARQFASDKVLFATRDESICELRSIIF